MTRQILHDPRVVEVVVRSDLYSFVQATFPIVSPNGSFLHNWHIEAMTFALKRVLDGDIKRLIITVPPRHLKSICASVAFPAFALGHKPTLRFVCASYSEKLAATHADACRALMRSTLYRRLFPNIGISANKDTQLEFFTTAGGYRLAASVGGTLTGRGGNIVIIDDPMKSQDAYSETARDNVKQWYSNTLLTRLDNKAEDSIIVVMQRLHPDDLAGFLLEQGGWSHVNLPAIAEHEHTIQLSQTRSKLRRPGDLLHPEREPRELLDEFKRTMGSLEFGSQYQQEPVTDGGNIIKWKWFGFHDDPPAWKSGDRIVVSWDTAMSGKELASYSACVVLQVRGDSIYVLDVVRERFEYPDLRRKVIELHRRWRKVDSNYLLLIENKGSGMSLIQDLKTERIYPLAIDPESDKIIRMNAQTPKIESSSVSLPRQAPWLDDFRREILAFPTGRYNDQVDAFSQALSRAYFERPRVSVGFVKGLI